MSGFFVRLQFYTMNILKKKKLTIFYVYCRFYNNISACCRLVVIAVKLRFRYNIFIRPPNSKRPICTYNNVVAGNTSAAGQTVSETQTYYIIFIENQTKYKNRL